MGELLSFGGGVNSTALAILLINEGWQGEIVFADTGAEWPETYEYMDYFETEWLKPRGFGIVRLHPHRDVKLFTSKAHKHTLIEYCLEAKMIPLAFRRWCTDRWKIQPLGRYAKQHDLSVTLLGIDAGEAHRGKDKVRPLVERGITRQRCQAIIAAEGLQIPPKSNCFFCMFQRESQWRRLWEIHPDLFDLAMRIEENSRRTRISLFPGQTHAVLAPNGRRTLRQRKMTYECQLSFW